MARTGQAASVHKSTPERTAPEERDVTERPLEFVPPEEAAALAADVAKEDAEILRRLAH